MTIDKKVMPNLIGINIGCGMTLAEMKDKKIEYQKLDKVIRECVPSGYAIRKKIHRYSEKFEFEKLHCYKHIRLEKALHSVFISI